MLFATLPLVVSLVLGGVQATGTSYLIHGGGVPGFWYALGFLDANPHLKNANVTCYSSGCAALATHVLGIDVEGAFDLANDTKMLMMNGTLPHTHAMTHFMGLVVNATAAKVWPPNLTILSTTVPTFQPLYKCPESLGEVASFVVASSSIPLITTPFSAFWATREIDGGFAIVLGTVTGGWDEEIMVPSSLSLSFDYGEIEAVRDYREGQKIFVTTTEF
jgi:hypothetical protein